MRQAILGSLLLLAGSSVASAERVVREISWEEAERAGQLTSGQLERGEGSAEPLRLENTTDAPKTITLLDLKEPGITSRTYALTGQVRYEGIARPSYLEMWSWFGGQRRCFSRTLGDSGLLQRLEGSSGWRPFSLPFFGEEKTGPPTRLVVNMVLGGRGTVHLSPLRLVEYQPGEDPLAMPGAWWSDRMGGLIGGIGGAVIGCLAGLVGCLAGFGRARQVALSLAAVLGILGAASLVLGLIALGMSQPYGVYYPLLLGGGIVTIVMGANWPVLRRRYQQLELRRMTALDLRTPPRRS